MSRGNGSRPPKPQISFSIIHHYGSPTEAVTGDGVTVHRQEKLYIEGEGGEIPCAPYDDHFIYLDTSGKIGRWFAMCTCGSAAVIVGSNAYARDASPQGKMLVCWWHASYGLHLTGGRKWE